MCQNIKRKKEPPNDVDVNLNDECVKISKEKNTKKGPLNDVDVNLSVECVKISQEKNTKKELPNNVGVNLSVECVKISKEKTAKKRKDIEDEQIDMNKFLKVDDKKGGED